MDRLSSHKSKSSTHSSTTQSSRSNSAYPSSYETPASNFYSDLERKEQEKTYESPYSPKLSKNKQRSQAPYPTYSSSSSNASSYGSPKSGQSTMSSSKKMTSADKDSMLRSLRTHRVNTLTELRRIEKLFDGDASKDVIEALTTGWAHYVNSNNLLSELRGMTKNYPFSSECLDEAKWQVIGDPSSTKSWNYCWLILQKIKTESLIKKHARTLAAKPAMWGGKSPSSGGIEKLANACVGEWTRAIEGMLRQWSAPPKTPGK